MAESAGEKTELPTARRRQEAREEGNVARSTDLTAAVSLLAAVLLLELIGFRLLTGMKVITRNIIAGSMGSNPTRTDDLVSMPALIGHVMVTSLLPFVLGVTLVGLVMTVSQVGFQITTKQMELDLTKLSPLKGIKNIFGLRGMARLGFSLGKVAIIGLVGGIAIYQLLPQIIRLTELDVLPMVSVACDMVFLVAIKLSIILLLLALLDYAYQRWQREKDLMMSKQEVKEEMKRMEGDPMVKQRRQRVARQLAMQRTAAAVPNADVIVTNPTHFAIALKYDSDKMRSPRVIAKGADFLAMRIRQIALKNGIPLVERKEVARGLYHGVEVGEEIPPQYYSAVAEILAYVYRIGGKKSA